MIWTLTEAHGVSNDKKIVGWYDVQGEDFGSILVLLPKPGTLMEFALAGVSLLRRRHYRSGAAAERCCGPNEINLRKTEAWRSVSGRHAFECRLGRVNQYISSMPPPGGPSGFFSGISETIASVVSNRPATLAAFWRAVRSTFIGTITPSATRSPYLAVMAL